MFIYSSLMLTRVSYNFLAQKNRTGQITQNSIYFALSVGLLQEYITENMCSVGALNGIPLS